MHALHSFTFIPSYTIRTSTCRSSKIIRDIRVIRGCFHKRIFIFFETLPIFFLCRGKQMIAPLNMGGRHAARTRAFATVDSNGTTL